MCPACRVVTRASRPRPASRQPDGPLRLHRVTSSDGRYGSGEHLSIKASDDDGRTWKVSRVLEPGISGYSDLAAASDGTVYCFYERGGVGAKMFHTQYLTVALFPVSWLRNQAAGSPIKISDRGTFDVTIQRMSPTSVILQTESTAKRN